MAVADSDLGIRVGLKRGIGVLLKLTNQLIGHCFYGFVNGNRRMIVLHLVDSVFGGRNQLSYQLRNGYVATCNGHTLFGEVRHTKMEKSLTGSA